MLSIDVAAKRQVGRLVRPGAIGVLLVLCVIAMITLNQFDSLLRGMHVPGRPAGSMGDLTFSLGDYLSSAEDVDSIVDTWSTHALEVGPEFSSALGIGLAYVLVDSLIFVPAYLLLLALLITLGLEKIKNHRDPYHDSVSSLVDEWWIKMLFLLGIADLIENLLQYIVLRQSWANGVSELVLSLLNAMTVVKALASAGVIFLLVLLLAIRIGDRLSASQGGYLRATLEPFTNVRVQLIMLAVFGAALLLPEQGWDVPRRWNLLSGAAAVAATLLYSLVSWEIGNRLLALETDPRPRKEVDLRSIVALGLVLLVSGGVMKKLDVGLPWGILIPGGMMVAIALLSWAVSSKARDLGESRRISAEETQRTTIEQRTSRLAQLLAAGPPIALGLALVRSSAGQLLYSSADRSRMAILFLLGLILPVVGFGLSWLLGRAGRRGRLRTTGLIVSSVAVLLLAAWAALPDTLWPVTRGLGAAGILALFALTLTMFAWGFVYLAERFEPPAFFKVLRLDRTPMLSLVVIWFLIASSLDSGRYVNVRLIPGAQREAPNEQGPVAGGASLSRVFDLWLQRQGLTTYSDVRRTATRARDIQPPPTTTSRAVPMIFVAASGGGIRAAFWTATVLDCIAERDPDFTEDDRCGDIRTLRRDFAASRDMFAASGISGGSLGLISYAGYLMQKADGDARPDWVAERLDEDFLAPTLGYQLFVEGARAFLRFDPAPDRAEIMERSWEHAWSDHGGRDLLAKGLRETWSEHLEVPLLILNGAMVNEGCRFVATVLDVGAAAASQNCLSIQPFERAQTPADGERAFAATHDLMDFLCRDQDIRLSTAALLSARFPFVSPPGRMRAQCGRVATDYIVDGGYFDTSAASPLVELWHAISGRVDFYNRQYVESTCLVPFFVQVDNGYEIPEVPAADHNPGDLFAPMKADKASRGAWLASSKQAAAIAFRAPFNAGQQLVLKGGWPLTDRYEHIYPRAHPGVQAPLGWVLSASAQADLRTQVDSLDNRQAIGEIRDWGAGTVTCAPASREKFYQPAHLDLGVPLDLSATWRVSDTESSLSLFRSRNDVNTAITFLHPGAEGIDYEPPNVERQLETNLENQGVPIVAEDEIAFGGISARRYSFSGCDRVDLNVFILPSHLVSPTDCSPSDYKRDPQHDVFDPSFGGGLRFNLLTGEVGECVILEYLDHTIVITVTAPDLENEEDELESGLAAAEALIDSL